MADENDENLTLTLHLDRTLQSVGERVKTHGRAFADPEKGGPGQALSAMQGRKLKEIAKKAKGDTKRD